MQKMVLLTVCGFSNLAIIKKLELNPRWAITIMESDLYKKMVEVEKCRMQE